MKKKTWINALDLIKNTLKCQTPSAQPTARSINSDYDQCKSASAFENNQATQVHLLSQFQSARVKLLTAKQNHKNLARSDCRGTNIRTAFACSKKP